MRLADLFTLTDSLTAGRPPVVTAAELRIAGAHPSAVRQAVARYWQVPVIGVYVTHREPLSDVELAHVAVAHAGADAVVSGLFAAKLLGMRWLPGLPGVLVLVASGTQRVSSEGIVVVRRCAALLEMRTWEWEGVRVASPAQVVVDSCRQLLAHRRSELGGTASKARMGWFGQKCLREVRGIVLGAVADGHCTAEQVRTAVDAGAMRDSALIRRACIDAERGAASPPEAELVDGLLEHGVLFACNVEVWDGDVLVAVLDVHLIGTGVGAEMDSKEAHEREDLLDATLQRHGRVGRAGIELCHVTPTRYRAEPARFHGELFAAARARLAQGLGDPPQLRFVPRGPVMRGGRPSSPPYRLPALRPPRAA